MSSEYSQKDAAQALLEYTNHDATAVVPIMNMERHEAGSDNTSDGGMKVPNKSVVSQAQFLKMSEREAPVSAFTGITDINRSSGGFPGPLTTMRKSQSMQAMHSSGAGQHNQSNTTTISFDASPMKAAGGGGGKMGSSNNLTTFHTSGRAPSGSNSNKKSRDVVGYSSDGPAQTRERKKGISWSEEEHRLFLLGLSKLGKGDWRGISRHFVVTRTPTQVASHAQKYFIRQNNVSKRKRRTSLFDISAHTHSDNGTVPSSLERIAAAATAKNVVSTSATATKNTNKAASQAKGTGSGNAHRSIQPSKSGDVAHSSKKSTKSTPNNKSSSNVTGHVVDRHSSQVQAIESAGPPINLISHEHGKVSGYPFLNGAMMHPAMQAALASALPQMLRQNDSIAAQMYNGGQQNIGTMQTPMPPQLSTLIPFLSQYPVGVTNPNLSPNLPFPLTHFNTFNGSWSNLPMPTGMDKFRRDSDTLFRPTPTHATSYDIIHGGGKPLS